jgi:hypothetical protein
MTTEELRARVEVSETIEFWGQKHTIVPRFIATVFGDGKQLILVQPMNTRPNYFVVRVDSSPDLDVFDIIDDIIGAAEDEYGYYDDEELSDAEKIFPIVDWSVGCSWSEPFGPSDCYRRIKPPSRSNAARILGAASASKAGKASAAKLTKSQRKARASRAGRARWAKVKAEKENP